MMKTVFYEKLLAASLQMAQTRDLRTLFEYVMKAALELVGAEYGHLILKQGEGFDFRVSISKQGETIKEPEKQVSYSILKETLETGEPLVILDAMEDISFHEAASVSHLALRSVMCAPLKNRQRMLGAIYVENRSEANIFEDEDLEPLSFFAAQAGVFIENAILSEDLEEQVAERTQALQESQRDLTRAQEIARLGSFRHSLVTGEVIWSRQLFQIAGLGDEERVMTRDEVRKLIHPEDIPRIEAEFERVVAGGQRAELDVRIMHPDGELRYTHDQFEAIYDEGGQAIEIFGTVQDITARKQAEAERENALDVLQTTIDGISDPIMLIGTDYQVKLVNQVVKEQYPYGDNKALYCYQVFHNRDTPCGGEDHPCPLVKVSALHAPVTVVHKHTHRDGEKRIVEVVASPLFDAEGVLTGIVEVNRDITERVRAEEAVRASEERYRNFYENVADVIYETDFNGRITRISPSIEKYSGYRPDELIGQDAQAFYVSPDDYEALASTMEREGTVNDLELRMKIKSGEILTVSVTARVVHDAHGQPVKTEGILRDITKRARAEAEIRKLSQAVEQSGSTVVITNLDGMIEFVNPAFTKITGYTPEEAIGENPRILSSGKTSPEVFEELWSTIARGEIWKGEMLNKKKNGELYWEFATIAPVKNSAGETTHYVAVKDDITERKNMEHYLEHVAMHDMLTGVPNRLLFYARMAQALTLAARNQWCIAVMFIDLDNFKTVNDYLGHDAGDQLLVDVAYLLQQCLRASDTVARMGGDEFVLLLPNISEREDAAIVAKKIIRELGAIFGQDIYRKTKISASIGISIYPEDGEDADTLLRAADKAMYRIKKDKKGDFLYYS